MEATDDENTYFYIHTLAAQSGGSFGLRTPERIVVDGQPESGG
jgi:hypothetical protein